MTRAALEHLLRAASAITNEREFVVIGSQAILGQYPNAPAALLRSIEADLYPRYAPDRSDVVDGALGELSKFHETFGYYAHGVDERTATLPSDWQDRLVPIENANTGGAIGWCLEAHDLAASKLVAGRERDLEFVSVLLQTGMVDRALLDSRLGKLPLPPDRLEQLRARLLRIVPSS